MYTQYTRVAEAAAVDNTAAFRDRVAELEERIEQLLKTFAPRQQPIPGLHFRPQEFDVFCLLMARESVTREQMYVYCYAHRRGHKDDSRPEIANSWLFNVRRELRKLGIEIQKNSKHYYLRPADKTKLRNKQ